MSTYWYAYKYAYKYAYMWLAMNLIKHNLNYCCFGLLVYNQYYV